jgi:hypothetical protein
MIFNKGWLLALPLLLFCAAGHAASPRTSSSSPRDQDLVGKINQRPMTFSIASGDGNACGPGCDKWIAAEGNVDYDAARRFREFLNEPRRRNLPVFFNSPGGSTIQARDMGRTLREYQMRAAVGRTVAIDCRTKPRKGEPCPAGELSSSEQRARLFTIDARCVSACVYALIGASVREVSPGAKLGIHAIRFVWTAPGPIRGSPPSMDEAKERLRNYIREMGIDPALVDLAAKVGPDDIHWLTRAEIEKLRIARPTP